MRTPRLRLAPINTGLYASGEPTDENIRFFSSRAGKGIGLCMVGNIAITPETVPNASTGVMSDNDCWSKLAEAIRKEGSIPGIQLSATLPGYSGQRTFFASDFNTEMEKYVKLFAQVSDNEWEVIGEDFTKAINLCWRHGFEHVQLHAAHGYAFSLALDPQVNPQGRGLDVLISLLEQLSSFDAYTASLRVSWHTGLPYDHIRQSKIIEIWSQFQSRIELDLSNGYYNLDKRHIYPPHEHGGTPFLNNAIALAKKFTDSSIIVAGNIWEPNKLLESIPPNVCISAGRALIADPYYFQRYNEDKSSRMLCDDCGDCHFFSKGNKSISCPQWII
jgi:NADPH2 dehydrogenase